MYKLLSDQALCLGDAWVPIYLVPVDFEPEHFETAMAHLIREPNINSTVILRADILLETVFGDDGKVKESRTFSPDLPEAKENGETSEHQQVPEGLKTQKKEKPNAETEEPQKHHEQDKKQPEDAMLRDRETGDPNPAGETASPRLLCRDLNDTQPRAVDLSSAQVALSPAVVSVRRIIPRNPYKDHILNQTCAVHKGENAVLVVYIAHISSADEVPFYLPPVAAVGILYCQGELSIHYVPFLLGTQGAAEQSGTDETPAWRDFVSDESSRPMRIALRLLQTLAKHSLGARAGYSKRVQHDLVVPRVAFQNRYIALKRKYLATLVASWVESTDPKKHVFEDLAVAAFLIELWARRFPGRDFEFRDLGCGNGLLVHILILEGFRGKGIDARARKSWKTYPPAVQANLLEQIIVPSVLLKPHPAVARMAPYMRDNGRFFSVPEAGARGVPLMKYYSAANLLELSKVCTTEEFPSNTFLIGNHLDELTCWLPLLGFPFMVIPCCSHALSGAKARFRPRKVQKPETGAAQGDGADDAEKKGADKEGGKNKGGKNKGVPQVGLSTYAALVDHVDDLATQMGWVVEKETLRIPSTRNAAIIGIDRNEQFASERPDETEMRVIDILATEGGAEGWVENLMALMKKNPKNH